MEGLRPPNPHMNGGGGGGGVYEEEEYDEEDYTEASLTENSSLFFADATLDLDTAHDIADANDARQPTISLLTTTASTATNTKVAAATTITTKPASRTSNQQNQKQLGNTTTTATTAATTTSSNRSGGVSSSDQLWLTQASGPLLSQRGPGETKNETAGVSAVAIHEEEDDDDEADDPEYDDAKSEFVSITSSRHHVLETTIPPPRHRPRWPRDVSWAIAFWILVPAGIIWPICMQERQQQDDINNTINNNNITTVPSAAISRVPETSPLVRAPLSTATLHALGWACVMAFFASRYFYRTAPGPDGEDARYHIGQVLQAATAFSVVVYATLVCAVWVWLPMNNNNTSPAWFWACLAIPTWFTIQHLILLRQWRKRGDRQAFFQALASMALDILSKSFVRRYSFGRVLSALLLLQTVILFLWRWAILGALGGGGAAAKKRWGMLLWAILAGKWATGTVARLVSFLASGGVYGWFVEQSAAVAALPQTHARIRDIHSDEEEENNNNNNNETNRLTAADDNNNNNNQDGDASSSSFGLFRMPEAYRTADGSVYQSVLEIDDGLSDDEEDEEENGDNHNHSINGTLDNTEQDSFCWESPSAATNRRRSAQYHRSRRHHHHRQRQRQRINYPGYRGGGGGGSGTGSCEPKFKSTVTSLLVGGLTVSFGSVVQCGLLGGLAQFVWSQLRKVHAAQSVWARLREARGNGNNSMTLNHNSTTIISSSSSTFTQEQQLLQQQQQPWWYRKCRQFVRNHSDLAMAHVAAYSKPYHKAALDVAMVIDRSGVEPILHDDITTHMCSAIGGCASGIICLFTGYILLEQRRIMMNKGGGGGGGMVMEVTDVQVFQDMLLAFVLCYTLIFTVMEPLRASIKAVYVSFAQHPQSLSQAYPLIYARLRRLSETNHPPNHPSGP